MRQFKRCPTHPGKILKEHYLKPLKLELNSTAKILGIAKSILSNILQEKEDISPEIALRLSKAFGTSPELWTGLQQNYDLWIAGQKYEKEIKEIPKLYISRWKEIGENEYAMNPKKNQNRQ